MSLSIAITPTSTAASVISRTSRLRMWEISCASTASSSRADIRRRRPLVTPTYVVEGREPAANAFGAGSSTR